MPTTKSDLIDVLAERLKLPKGKAETIVNTVFDRMTRALQEDERIEIRGFGSFEVRSYKAYEGRNPRTGEPVHVAPKKLPFFKVGKELRERVNGDGHEDGADGAGNGRDLDRAAANGDGRDPAGDDGAPSLSPRTESVFGGASRGAGGDSGSDPGSSPSSGFSPL